MCFYCNRRIRRQKVTGFFQDFTKNLQNRAKTSFPEQKKADPCWVGQVKEYQIRISQAATGEMACQKAVSAARPGIAVCILIDVEQPEKLQNF